MKNRIALCLTLMPLVLFSSLSVHGQFDATRRVTLQIDNITLEDLIRRLDLEFGVSVAYGSDNIPIDLMISVNLTNATLIETIQIICLEAGLTYQIVDDVLIFQRLGNEPEAEMTVPSLSPASDAILNARGTTPVLNQESHESDSLASDSPRREVSLPGRPFYVSSPNKVPRLRKLQFKSMIPPKTNDGRPLVYQTGLFFTYSADFDNFHFLKRDPEFQTFSRVWNQSFGMGG